MNVLEAFVRMRTATDLAHFYGSWGLALETGLAAVTWIGGGFLWARYLHERAKPRWCVARITRLLALGMASGIGPAETFRVAGAVGKPHPLALHLAIASEREPSGRPWSEVVTICHDAPVVLVQSLKNAEATGKVELLDHTARQIEAGVLI